MELVERVQARLGQLAAVDLHSWLVADQVGPHTHLFLLAARSLPNIEERAMLVEVFVVRELARDSSDLRHALIRMFQELFRPAFFIKLAIGLLDCGSIKPLSAYIRQMTLHEFSLGLSFQLQGFG